MRWHWVDFAFDEWHRSCSATVPVDTWRSTPMQTWPGIILRIAPLLIACVFAHAAPGFAQSPSTGTITGVVLDERTERPLEGVLVMLEHQSGFVETDQDGRFTLTASPGTYTVTASLVGYAFARQEVDVRIGAATSITLRLAEGAGTYKEHVTVSGSLQSEADAAPGGSELHGRELQNLRGVMLDDPLRAVQSLPSVTATDDLYSEFAVRGNEFRHIGLTVDGIPSRYLMHTVHGVTDGGSIAMVNSETLGSVSLFPGSYTQRAGRHIGAHVDLGTREGSRDGFHGRAGLSGTSAAMLVEGPLANGRGSWLASVRRSYLDLLIKQIDPEADFAFGFTDAQGKLVYDVAPAHQLQLTALAGRAGFSEDDPASLSPNDEAETTGTAWLASLGWRYAPNARVVLTQRVYATGLRYDNLNNADVVLDAGRFNDFGWRADGSFAPHSRAAIEFGGDVQHLSFDRQSRRFFNRLDIPVPIADDTDTALAASSYAQVRMDITPWLSVVPGARFDYWELTDTSVASPWMQVETRLGSRSRLRAAAGIYRQFADFEQVFGINGGGRSLEPERARHADVGVDYELRRDVRVQLTGYDRNERDVLWRHGFETRLVADGTIQLGRGDAPWVNALDGSARGVELVIRRDAPNGVSGWFGYGYGRLRYTDRLGGESFPADKDQRHTLSTYVHYRISNRSTVSTKFRYGSNYPIVGYVTERAPAGAPPLFGGDQLLFLGLSDTRNTLRLPAYSRLDVRADRTFNWGSRRLTLFAEVANVLNHTNLRNVPYDFDRTGRVFGATESLMPIIPSAGFVIEF
jgi:hypothetical protein